MVSGMVVAMAASMGLISSGAGLGDLLGFAVLVRVWTLNS